MARSSFFSGSRVPGPSDMPTIGASSARQEAREAQAGMMEQQQLAAWYQAHPDRAIHILGHEGAAAMGIESPQWKLEQKRKEAKIEAEQWEARYTARDRQDIARLNNGKKQLMQNPNFSEEERAEAVRTIDMQIAGIEPSLIPRDPDKQTFAPDRGPQDQWIDEKSGASVALDRSNNIRTLVQPDKMPAAIEVRNQMEREKSLADSRLKLMMASVKDDEGVEVSKYRDVQVESMLEATYPWYREQQIKRSQEERQTAQANRAQQADEGVQARAENVWWADAERSGLDIQEIDKSLPPEIGLAQAVLREYEEYEDVPDGKKQAWLEAFKTYSNALNSLEQ